MKKPIVLVIEDRDLQRELLKDCLVEICSCDVICSCDGEEGIKEIEKRGREIHIVFTDFRMPRKNGLEVVKFIKKNFATIKVVMMTADPLYMVREAALAAGVDELLEKPFEIADLNRLISEARLVY